MQRLALRWGWPNVNALGRAMTAKEMIQWNAYFQLEPFEEIRADWRAAQIAAMVFNMAVASKDRKHIKEFLLKFGEDEEVPYKQTVEEQLKILNILAMTASAKGD